MQLEDIWTAYQARLRGFLSARVSNPADVDDLLQEIMIKVHTGLPSLEEPAKLQPWLFQTARRTIIDFYRKAARGKTLHPDDLWYGEDDPEVRQELARCVEPFIAALPEETAAVLRAVDIEGGAQKGLAEAQGISYSTLKSRVQKGRAALRDVFEDCCSMSRDARGNLSDYERKSGGCEKC